ncbi:MAG: 16S rRNA (cytidine(1402)-2'-O)-methyltransferase [Steroidobacteraceae bacterium]
MILDAPSPAVSQAAKGAGTLYVVATPIGNLEDLSARARQILSSVELIAAEDTRHSGKLLQVLGCHTPMLSLHEHNEVHRTDELLARLKQGLDVALISDAGTPLISDPGYNLVNELTQQGIRVVPIPGACAAIAALSVAGLPTGRFAFEGFLAAKPNKRRERLRELLREERTLVFYEAPHRCRETLEDMVTVLGGTRRIAICRELTKLHETSYYGDLATLAARAAEDADLSRGELVFVVEGASAVEGMATTLDAEQLLSALLEELPASQAAKVAAKITGVERAQLYERAISLKGK